MNPISSVTHSPLTQEDITRLPGSATGVQPAPTPAADPDAYVPSKKKSSFWKKTIITAVVLALLAVGAKRFGGDLLKVDAANPKWSDPIKKGIAKVADWVEYPFMAIKNLFTKKEVVDAAKKGAEAVQEGAEAVKEGAETIKKGAEAVAAAAS